MTYEFACGDVMPGCAATFHAETKDELMGEIAQHARDEHDIQEISPQVAQAVEQGIRTA